MADGLNKVILLGNLGQDPELRVTPGGQAVMNLSLATNESFLDRNNVRQERTEWHRVAVWGRRAEALAKILTKGSQILVEGKLQTSTYEKNGEKRYSTQVVALDIKLCGGKSGKRPAGSQGAGQGRRAAGGSGAPPADTGAQDGGFADEFAGRGDDDIPF